MNRTLVGTAFFLAAALGWIDLAHAYLDPGTGSLLLQGIIGAVAGGMAIAGFYWQRLKAFFRPRTTSEKDTLKDERVPD